MSYEAPLPQKYSSTSQPAPRRRCRPHIIATVAAITLIIVVTLFFSGFFTLDGPVEITVSNLRSGSGFSSNYRWVAVDVSLYNPGWNRRITVWAEITCQLTQTSYSKGQYVHMGFRESKEVTVDFTFDTAIDLDELTHRTWITYIEQD